MIRFKNVTKKYGEKTVVDNISFDINQGEVFVLIGPSGCGKTTTLKMINRLIPLTTGEIHFKDKRISDYPKFEMRWDIGYVLQQIALFPHMTIEENIAQVPQMKQWPKDKTNKRIDELLAMTGLDPKTYRNRYPSELSGGQQQRIGVVRALAADPPVILMDEPFSSLDPITRVKLQDDLLDLQSEIKKTIIFVTHDISEALKLGDRICLLNEGKIEQIGTPEEFIHNPKSDFVKDFLGDIDTYLLNKVKLKDVIDDLPLLEYHDNVNYPIVSGDAFLSEIYDELANASPILVQTGMDLRVLKRKDVFRILAETKRGVQ